MTKARQWWQPFLLGAGMAAAGALVLIRRNRRDGPIPPGVGGQLDRLNAHFHDAYREARRGAELQAPVIVVLGDDLVFMRLGERRVMRFMPPIFHAIKAVAHGPVALFSALRPVADGASDGAALARLPALRRSLIGAGRELARWRGSDVAVDLSRTVDTSVALIDEVAASGAVEVAALDAFAAELGPVILRCTAAATRAQLDGLDAQVQLLLKAMNDDERAALQVVVTGDHQARVRSPAMQYFEKLFGEPPGLEKRVTYAEDIARVDEALALVGTRRLDRVLAGAFFGDALRLQRDVLGDAARDYVDAMRVPALGPPES